MWATPTTGDCQLWYTFSRFKKVRNKYNNNLWTILFAISIHSICCKIYESLLISRLVFSACLFVCCSNGYLICFTLLFLCDSTDFSNFYTSISTSIPVSFSTEILDNLSQIRLSHFVSLGAGQIILLAGINAIEETVGASLPFVEFVQRKPPWMNCKNILSPLLLKAVCVTVAALMQYFLMARFLLDARRGIHLYLFVVKVSNINTKMHMYHVISWGILIFQLNLSYTVRDYFVS